MLKSNILTSLFISLLFCVPICLPSTASAETQGLPGLTEKEQAVYWFKEGDKEKSLLILKNVWTRDNTYGAGIDYGYYLLKANQVEQGISQLERVIKQFPEYVDADLVLSTYYKEEEQYDEAEKVLYNLYLRFPEDIRAVKEYASILLVQKKFDFALLVLEKFEPAESDMIDYLAIYGAVQFDSENYRDALRAYQQLSERKPKIIDFQLSLGKCYRKLKAYESAEMLYRDIKREFQSSGDPWFENGALYMDTQEWEKAKEQFLQAKERYLKEAKNLPEGKDKEKKTQKLKDRAKVAQELIDEVDWTDAKAVMSRGDYANACPAIYEVYIRNDSLRYGFDSAVCFRELKKLDVSKVLFLELIHKYPDNSDLFVEYYETLKAQENTQDAKQLLLDFVGEYGYKNPKVVSRLAGTALGEEKYQDAIDILQKGQPYVDSKQPPLAFLFIAGTAYRALGKTNQAEIMFTKAKQQAPELLETHMALFDTKQKSGATIEAEIMLTELMEDVGLTARVRLKRAGLYLAQKQWHKVLEDCEVVLQDPTIPEDSQEIGTAIALTQDAKIELAKLKHAKGKAKEAVQLLQEIYFLKPDTRNAINLGVFASMIGESDRTDTILETALLKDPDNNNIRQVWAEVLMTEHRAPEALDVLSMTIGKDHIYKHGLSLLAVKALMELGWWSELGDTLEAIKVQPLEDAVGNKLDSTGELPPNMWAIEAIYYDKTNKPNKAIQTWQKLANKSDADEVLYKLELANLLDMTGKQKRSQEILNQLKQEFPHDETIERAIYKLKTQQEINPSEQTKLDPITIMQPGEGFLPLDMWSDQAKLDYNNREFDTVMMSLEKSIQKVEVEEVAYRLEISNVYKSRKENPAAKEVLEELLTEFPNHAAVWKAYSNLQLSMNNPDGWQESGQKAVDILLTQSNENFWLEIDRQMALGNAYFNLMDFEKTESTFLQILDVLPFHYGAQSTLGYLYLEMKDYYRAAEAFKEAYLIQPKNPFALSAMIKVNMKTNASGFSRYWEDFGMEQIKEFDSMVEDNKAASLGVFGYRPTPNIGTLGSFTRLSVRPTAMTLVRETAFSDQPVGGFQIDQRVYKQSLGLFGIKPSDKKMKKMIEGKALPSYFELLSPALWVDFTRVNSSGSLDVLANLFEFKSHHSKSLQQGILQLYPSFVLLFENEKYVQTTARTFPMGKLKVNFRPTGSHLLYEAKASYGVQRLDKYGLPTEFFLGSGSVAWGKGLNSLFQSVSVRQDKLPSGVNFSSVLTESALQTSFLNRKVIPSMLIQTENLIGLPKLDTAFGYTILGKVEYNVDEQIFPYATAIRSHSKQYEYENVYQVDLGMRYQNTLTAPTYVNDREYSYKVPFQLQIAYQQFWYPNSSIPESKTLFFSARII